MEACHFCTLFTATVLIITCSRHRHPNTAMCETTPGCTRTRGHPGRCTRAKEGEFPHLQALQRPQLLAHDTCSRFACFLSRTLLLCWLMAHTNQHCPSQRAKQQEREPRHPPVRYVSPPKHLMHFMFFVQSIHARFSSLHGLLLHPPIPHHNMVVHTVTEETRKASKQRKTTCVVEVWAAQTRRLR